MFNHKIVVLFMLALFNLNCKKFIEVGAPNTSTNAANVYNSDATAAAVLTGIYANIEKGNIAEGGITSLSYLLGLSSDELTLFDYSNQNASLIAYYKNALTSTKLSPSDFWSKIYPIIFVANSAIEGINKSTSLTPQVKQHLLGEAKFLRAFCYFYLVNLYGNVPLVLNTDYEINSLLSRAPISDVYQQIIIDLKEAQNNLSSNYLKADIISLIKEKVRPTKWAATSLLSRVYLFVGDYANAEMEASKVINSSIFRLTSLDSSFLKNNDEAIWQLQPVTTTPSNTWDGYLFLLPAGGPNTAENPVYLNDRLINSFELGDLRKVKWVGSVTTTTETFQYANKYKEGSTSSSVSEYLVVLRLAELYLIRAEARAQQNNISGAQDDLNIIRNRSGLPNTTANDKVSLLAAILHERQIELFTEWGHRWLDLKRTNNIDIIMPPVAAQKGSTWNTNWKWYPIPQYELTRAPNLIQNEGY